jgi:hypothetical protein
MGFINYYLVLIVNSMGRIRFVKKVFKVSRDSWWDFCYSAIFFSSDGNKHHCQRIEQIVCSPNCDRVTRILRFLSKIFNLVPGVDQAYQDSHGIINYYLELIVNPAGKILVRWKSFRNLEIQCQKAKNKDGEEESWRSVYSACVYVCICIYVCLCTCMHIHLRPSRPAPTWQGRPAGISRQSSRHACRKRNHGLRRILQRLPFTHRRLLAQRAYFTRSSAAFCFLFAPDIRGLLTAPTCTIQASFQIATFFQ